MKKTLPVSGFTLVEIMVALAILSLALAAALYTSAHNTAVLSRVKQHILANMVATDAQAALSLGLAVPSKDNSNLTVQIADETFAWRSDFSSLQNTALTQLSIDVFQHHQPILNRQFGIMKQRGNDDVIDKSL